MDETPHSAPPLQGRCFGPLPPFWGVRECPDCKRPMRAGEFFRVLETEDAIEMAHWSCRRPGERPRVAEDASTALCGSCGDMFQLVQGELGCARCIRANLFMDARFDLCFGPVYGDAHPGMGDHECARCHAMLAEGDFVRLAKRQTAEIEVTHWDCSSAQRGLDDAEDVETVICPYCGRFTEVYRGILDCPPCADESVAALKALGGGAPVRVPDSTRGARNRRKAERRRAKQARRRNRR